MVDFSKSDKPDYPPVPLQIEIDRTSLGEIKFVFTDPSGTLNKDPTYPLNVWTSIPPHQHPNHQPCPTFPSSSTFQDMHDGDVKTVTYDSSSNTLKMGQADVDSPWSLVTDVDIEKCTAVIDFSTTDKADFPPVPLLATILFSHASSDEGHIMLQFTDPSSTLNDGPHYPLNVWQLV